MAYWCVLRKANPFNTPAWLEQPWIGKDKTIRDKLYDIVVATPELLERSDKANLPGNDALRLPLIQDILLVHRKMQAWMAEARMVLRIDDTGLRVTPFFMDDSEYLMTHGMDVASAAMWYWSISVLLNVTLRVLSAGVPRHHRIDTTLDDVFNPRGHAMNIVKCMHHFLNADAGLIGFQNSTFPLGSAMMYFAMDYEVETAERQTIRRHLWGASSVKPYGPMMGAFLQQLQEENLKKWNAKKGGNGAEYHVQRQRAKVWFEGKVHEPDQAT